MRFCDPALCKKGRYIVRSPVNTCQTWIRNKKLFPQNIIVCSPAIMLRFQEQPRTWRWTGHRPLPSIYDWSLILLPSSRYILAEGPASLSLRAPAHRSTKPATYCGLRMAPKAEKRGALVRLSVSALLSHLREWFPPPRSCFAKAPAKLHLYPRDRQLLGRSVQELPQHGWTATKQNLTFKHYYRDHSWFHETNYGCLF